jgi:hypothetical protein
MTAKVTISTPSIIHKSQNFTLILHHKSKKNNKMKNLTPKTTLQAIQFEDCSIDGSIYTKDGNLNKKIQQHLEEISKLTGPVNIKTLPSDQGQAILLNGKITNPSDFIIKNTDGSIQILSEEETNNQFNILPTEPTNEEEQTQEPIQ